MPSSFLLDPESRLDFAFDFTQGDDGAPGFLAVGETITAYTVVADTGLTLGDGTTMPAASQLNGVVTYWVTGGQVGSSYYVTCHITTSAGRQLDRSSRFWVQPL